MPCYLTIAVLLRKLGNPWLWTTPRDPPTTTYGMTQGSRLLNWPYMTRCWPHMTTWPRATDPCVRLHVHEIAIQYRDHNTRKLLCTAKYYTNTKYFALARTFYVRPTHRHETASLL